MLVEVKGQDNHTFVSRFLLSGARKNSGPFYMGRESSKWYAAYPPAEPVQVRTGPSSIGVLGRNGGRTMAARKQSPAQLENLKKGKRFTEENATIAAKKAAEARREYKSLQSRAREKITPEDWDEILQVMIQKAKDGNLKAIELLRDSAGDKPTDRVELAGAQDLKVNITVRDEGR